MSGGCPPATAVDRSGGGLPPPDVYLTVTFGYFLLNASMICWKNFCSSAVQMPTIDTLPETFAAAGALVFEDEDDEDDLLLLPQPATTTAITSAIATTKWIRLLLLMKVPLLSPGRRR